MLLGLSLTVAGQGRATAVSPRRIPRARDEAASAGTTVRPSATRIAAASSPEVDQATLVRTIDTSRWKPPSPDPSGIVYMPGSGRLEVTDSEVDEIPSGHPGAYRDVNLWQITRTGAVKDTTTTWTPAPAFTREPTGLGFIPSTHTLLVSSDDDEKVFFDKRGADGRFGTADDVVSSISTSAMGLDDTEDPTFDPVTGHLFVLDGASTEVYDIDPRKGGFGNGDDVVTHFDFGRYGPSDAEGLSSDPSRNTLLIGERKPAKIYEVTKDGDLVRIIDASDIDAISHISGLALAPASNGSGQMNYWIVDRRIDNDLDINENDGKLFELAAPAPNTPPTLGPIGDKTIPELETLTFTATASDPDLPADVLTFSLEAPPAGAAIDPDTGEFSFTPTHDQVGDHTFDVCVSDGQSSDCETITVTVTPAPLFADDFESGDLSKWSGFDGMTVQRDEVANGGWAARATAIGSRAFATEVFGQTQTDLYYRIAFEVISRGTDPVNVMRVRSKASPIARLWLTRSGRLRLRNEHLNTNRTSTIAVVPGGWHSLELHVEIDGAEGASQVWLDGSPVPELDVIQDLGTDPINRIYLGEVSNGTTSDVAYDDVVVDSRFV